MIQQYFKDKFLYDLKAGFITAVVALPLAIAFAIASGVHPIMGLYTAIIAGILGSALGGSQFSITGPTGAMTVIILSTVNKFGLEGLLVAGFLAGLIQIALGAIRLGRFVKFIPFPIVSGFTAGIGVIIFIGQIPNAFGLTIASQEHVWETLWEIIKHIPQANLLAIGITAGTILCLVFLPKILPKIKYLKNVPPSIIPLLLATAAAFLLHLNIPQVGAIPSGLPTFTMLNINLDLILAVLPAAFTIALLGAIEALLCAVVCDGMTNSKHKSDKELIGQGVCNTLLPFLGGIPCTAAIARSAVNIREGAKTRMAGVIHGVFLLLVLLFLSPIAYYIPKSFLAGVLMFVSAKMINVHEFKTIMSISRSETIVLFITFGMTVLTDLVLAVEVGMVLAIFLLFIRLSSIIDISGMEDYKEHTGINAMVFSNPTLKDVVSVYTLHGPFFFGAMNLFDKKAKEHMGNGKPVVILRMKYVPFIDSTGVVRLNDFIKEKQKNKSVVMLTDLAPAVHKTLKENAEFKHLMKHEYIFDTTKEALHYVENNLHTILLLR